MKTGTAVFIENNLPSPIISLMLTSYCLYCLAVTTTDINILYDIRGHHETITIKPTDIIAQVHNQHYLVIADGVAGIRFINKVTGKCINEVFPVVYVIQYNILL